MATINSNYDKTTTNLKASPNTRVSAADEHGYVTVRMGLTKIILLACLGGAALFGLVKIMIG